jgi:hypothetical protein
MSKKPMPQKVGDKIKDKFIAGKKNKDESVTFTFSAQPPEPDWKAIAYELANIIEDIDLHFQTKSELLNKDNEGFYESPDSRFHIKKFIAAQKHFIRYKNELLYIDDYNKKKETESKMREMLFRSIKK